MNKSFYSILFLLTMMSFTAAAQDLLCVDFKQGSFYVPADEINSNSYVIIREGNKQQEIIKDDNGTKTFFEVIEWIDECSYRMKYDDSKMELDPTQRFINDNGGMLVEKTRIDGNCFLYKSTLKGNGIDIKVDGKMCKK